MIADGRRILVSAGEPSGDMHGADLVRALRSRQPESLVEGCGGPRMAAAGASILRGIDQLSAIGFLEVIRSVPRHLRLLRQLEQSARAGRYGLAVLIDYPGFHLRLGQALRRAGVPVLQYVAPQLWAWRPGRVALLRRAAQRVAAILPFEPPWFAAHGIDCEYVGHPLRDRSWPTAAAARQALELHPSDPVLGIFPGSRAAEIQRHWPLFREAALQLLAGGHCAAAVVAGTAEGYYPEPGPIRIQRDASDQVLAAATAGLIKSGTTTLEAALTGTPMVVVYRASRTTHAIARRLMTVDRISLVNLVAEQEIVPEFWRLPIRAVQLAARLRPLLDAATAEHRAQQDGLGQVRQRLGPPGAAARAATMALQLAGA